MRQEWHENENEDKYYHEDGQKYCNVELLCKYSKLSILEVPSKQIQLIQKKSWNTSETVSKHILIALFFTAYLL